MWVKLSNNMVTSATPRKAASWNFWARSNGRIKSYGALEPILSTGDKTSLSPSSHSKATASKTTFGNPGKNLSAMQRSDQQLWHIWADTQVRATRHPRHRVAIPSLPQGKQPMETLVNVWARSNGRIKSYGAFEPILHYGWPDIVVTE